MIRIQLRMVNVGQKATTHELRKEALLDAYDWQFKEDDVCLNEMGNERKCCEVKVMAKGN